jgi:hypothetical protein
MGRHDYTLTSRGTPVHELEHGGERAYLDALRTLPHKFHLQDAQVSGGYDRGGAYWGDGDRVYLAQSVNGHIFRSYRAKHRAHAFQQLREEFPHARAFGFAADITKRDTRYQVQREAVFDGHDKVRKKWYVLFCGERIKRNPHFKVRADALRAANLHDVERLK